LRWPTPTQGCKADDNDEDDCRIGGFRKDDHNLKLFYGSIFLSTKVGLHNSLQT
jgi:hypothetical protein